MQTTLCVARSCPNAVSVGRACELGISKTKCANSYCEEHQCKMREKTKFCIKCVKQVDDVLAKYLDPIEGRACTLEWIDAFMKYQTSKPLVRSLCFRYPCYATTHAHTLDS
jgi:hypothetical protein